MRSSSASIGRAAAAALAALTLIVFAGAAPAQTSLLWSFSGLENVQAIAAVPDIDGDGGVDVVFDTYDYGPSGVDHLFAVRGASSGTGTLLWSARPIGGLTPGGGYGDNCLRLGSDYNGDGEPDLLFATAYGCRTAFALDKETGATLWSYDTYAVYGQNNAGWIYAMDDLGSDLTGDGVSEVVFCSGSYNDRVHCVNGATGAMAWVYYGGDAFMDIRSCQDINGDGTRDVVACLGDDAVPEKVIALSGINGAILWQRQIGNSLWNLAFIDDLTGDGIREVVPSTWGSTLTCINGADGSVVWSVATNGQQRVAALDDVNGDGVADIAVGYNTTSAARCFSGANGALLWSAPFTDWTWAIDRVADVTGDGINDVAVGDFDGKATVLDGVTGQVFWSWLNPTGDKVMTIRGVPDLNGNGVPDIVAGTQMLTNGLGGDVYALEGNLNPTGVETIAAATGLRLSETYPNPSRGAVEWRLAAGMETGGDGSLGRACEVVLELFGVDGRLVRTLDVGAIAPGSSLRLQWDGRDEGGAPVPAGIYHARVREDGRTVAARRMVITR